MKYKKTKHFKMPVLGLGTYYLAGYHQADHSKDRELVDLLKKAIKIGYTHIDTAEKYGAGHSEVLIGKAIKDFKREKLFITSKVRSVHLKYDDVIKSAKKSLKRLQTDYIDLYLIHRPSSKIPLKETMAAMNYLKEKGLIKHIGVSNFNVKQLKEAQKYAKIVANQVEQNLLVRNKGMFNVDMEKEIIPYCQKNDILVIAFRPLAFGILARKGLAFLDEMAKKYKISHVRIALSWLVKKPGVVTIVKSTDLKHLRENLKFVNLSKKDIQLLDKREL